jgi:hypothetical protein
MYLRETYFKDCKKIENKYWEYSYWSKIKIIIIYRIVWWYMKILLTNKYNYCKKINS